MIDFYFKDPVPALPAVKHDEKIFNMVAGGVKIECTLRLDSDTKDSPDWDIEHFRTLQLQFESVTKLPGDCGYDKPVCNPISPTGYRNHFFFVPDNPPVEVDSAGQLKDSSFDFEEYLREWLRNRLDDQESRWEQSKQISLF